MVGRVYFYTLSLTKITTKRGKEGTRDLVLPNRRREDDTLYLDPKKKEQRKKSKEIDAAKRVRETRNNKKIIELAY
jgi:hypothetical protein